MKKQISKLMILTLLAQVVAPVFFNNSYAAETTKETENCWEWMPAVCTATSPHLTTYLEFQKEVWVVLSTNQFKTARESVLEWKGWLFTSEILKVETLENFNESLAWRALRVLDITLTRSTTSLLTSAFLFELAAIWALADNSIGLTILFQDRAIVRDRTKLLDVEWSLTQTAYALWVAWDIWRSIKDAAALDNIVNNYAGKWLFESGASFWGGVAYMDAIKLLAELNSSVKWFIAYDSKALLEDFNANHPKFSLKKEWIEELSREYKCARWWFWFKCNTSWASLKNNIKILTNNTNNQWKSSVKQIKDSYNDLKAALWDWTAIKNRIKGEDLKLSDRERQILQGRYWLDAARLTKGESSWLISLNTNLKSQRKRLSKWVTTAVQWIKWTIAEYKKIYKESKQAVQDMQKAMSWDAFVWNRILAFFWWNVDTWKKADSKWVKMYNQMKDMLDRIATSKNSSTSIVTTINNKDLTMDYSVISVAVDNLIEAIWDKNKWLRQQLNLLCTAQCSNKWNDCCYVK